MMAASAQHGFTGVMELYLKKGADIRAKNTAYGGTLLHDAALGGSTIAARFLLGKGLGPNERAADEATPIITAAKKGFDPVIEILLTAGADINAKDKFSRTALHYASEKGHKNLAAFLIDRGADKTIKDAWGKTYDQIKGEEDGATIIVVPGATSDVQKKDADGNTALHRECLKGNVDGVSLLVSKGADINARNNAGYTPLHSAAEKGKISVIQFLLSKGARPDLTDAKGNTPAALAKKKGHMTAFRMLDAAIKKQFKKGK
jgi:ankyrin repeat protein